MQTIRTTLLAMAAVAALAGCNKGATSGSASAPSSSANTVADTTPQGPSPMAALFGGGKPMPLDQQTQSASGAVFQFTSLQAKPTETVLGVKIVNGAQRDIVLEWTDQKSFLVAGGQKFFLSPPLENPRLTITKGATMQGELVFLGRLPKGQAVTLVLNDGQSDSQYSSNPNLSVPLQVTDAAFSDDGSKKN